MVWDYYSLLSFQVDGLGLLFSAFIPRFLFKLNTSVSEKRIIPARTKKTCFLLLIPTSWGKSDLYELDGLRICMDYAFGLITLYRHRCPTCDDNRTTPSTDSFMLIEE